MEQILIHTANGILDKGEKHALGIVNFMEIEGVTIWKIRI
jgi:hypothetical protein